MRNMLAFLAAMALTVAAVGWYLDWYRVRTTPAPSGQRSVTVDINTEKIGDDFHKAEQKIQQKLAEKIEKANAEKKAREAQATEVPTADLTVPSVTTDERR
jgi:hypothetical protein